MILGPFSGSSSIVFTRVPTVPSNPLSFISAHNHPRLFWPFLETSSFEKPSGLFLSWLTIVKHFSNSPSDIFSGSHKRLAQQFLLHHNPLPISSTSDLARFYNPQVFFFLSKTPLPPLLGIIKLPQLLLHHHNLQDLLQWSLPCIKPQSSDPLSRSSSSILTTLNTKQPNKLQPRLRLLIPDSFPHFKQSAAYLDAPPPINRFGSRFTAQ